MKLFEYCVIYDPNAESKRDGAKAKVLVPVTSVLASDSASATLLAGRSIPPEYLDKLDEVKVACRPF